MLSYQINSAVLKFLPVIIILHCLFGIYMLGSEDIFPIALQEINGKIIPKENGIFDRLFTTTGALLSGIIFLVLFVSLLMFCYSNILRFCRKQSAKVEEETQNLQGNYTHELDIIKRNGLHTYDIQENPEYRDLILSLDNAANNVQILRNNLIEKKTTLGVREPVHPADLFML